MSEPVSHPPPPSPLDVLAEVAENVAEAALKSNKQATDMLTAAANIADIIDDSDMVQHDQRCSLIKRFLDFLQRCRDKVVSE